MNSVLDAIRKEREHIEKREREGWRQEKQPNSSSTTTSEEKPRHSAKVSPAEAPLTSAGPKDASRGTTPPTPQQPTAAAEGLGKPNGVETAVKKEGHSTMASARPMPQQRPMPPSPESPPIETPVKLASTPPPMKVEEEANSSVSKTGADSQVKVGGKAPSIPTPPASPSAAHRPYSYPTVTGASLRMPQADTKPVNHDTESKSESIPPTPAESISKPTAKVSPVVGPKTSPVTMVGRGGVSTSTGGNGIGVNPNSQSKTLSDRFEVPKDDEVAELSAEELKLLLDRLEHKVRVARKALLVQNIK